MLLLLIVLTFVIDVLEFLSAYFGILVHILAVFDAYLHAYFTLFKCITIRSLVHNNLFSSYLSSKKVFKKCDQALQCCFPENEKP